MDIRFYNGKILLCQDGFQIIDGEVWTKGDRICYVGPGKEHPEGFTREIDLEGNLLMPGFKNAHTHSAMTFLRSYADDCSLQDWLHNQVFPMEAKLDGEMVYWFSKLANIEYLSSGITANFDMYFELDAIVQASVDMGFRTVLCGSVNDFGGSAQSLEADYRKYNAGADLISHQLGFHAEYTTSLALMGEIAELAKQLKTPVFAHNSETKKETEECIGRYGKTPTELFDGLGMHDYGGGGFHCVHFSEHDIEIYREKGLWAVTNPASNLKLASGIAPLTRMLERGVSLGIGTDGPASNNALDMFRELYLASVLQKFQEEDASACPAPQVLSMAVTGSARAMGLTECDCIAEGKKADMIVIDLRRPNMQPEHNLVKNLVYSGSKENVALTMINGRILYEKGEFFVGDCAERIYEKVGELVRKIKAK